MNSKSGTLPKSTNIDEKYTVQFFIKKGAHAETYRVKDSQGKNCFLKLFQYPKLHRTQFDAENNVKEIELLKTIDHPNIVQYLDSGDWFYNNQRLAYLVLGFISGETLAERVKREHTLSWPIVKHIATGVLNGLKYLHNQPHPIVHNDINIQNIMLDLSSKDPVPKLIDFGHARYFQNATKVFYREGLNPFYLAPECFNNIFSPQSDLFAVGAAMYHLLFGMPPWFIDLSHYQKDTEAMQEAILEAREKPLKKPILNNATDTANIDHALAIIETALHENIDQRFSSAEEMLDALNGKMPEKPVNTQSENKSSNKDQGAKNTGQYKGFSEIAGMEELKETLYNDVIRALAEKELYEEYGLTIPNGMLLYGPPGCGKSFIAEKLAEEAGYHFEEIKPSSLASIYVHGSQEKIGQLFDEARKNAPTILNFEEFDALVPKRDGHAGSHQAGEVNEFLTQLNNCGKNEVFVIATSNQPGLIDPAVMRAGRIDKLFYVPPPDFKARKAMFQLLLKKRPVDFGIDYDQLAYSTENFVSADIQHLVNEAARKALKQKAKITQEILQQVIEETKPSVSDDEIKKYEQIRSELEGKD